MLAQKANPIPILSPLGRLRLLTLARDLKRRKSRERHSLFVAEGVRAVDELLRSKLTVRGVLTAPQLDGAPRGLALRELIVRTGVDNTGVTESEFRSAAETESPQGVVAIAEIPVHTFSSLGGRPGLRLLVLDAIQDPGNAGTMIRTAAAFGMDATVALPGTVDLWNAKVVRSAMGASFHHPVFHAPFDDLSAFLDSEGMELWGADGAGDPLEDAQAAGSIALAVGNEGAGLSSTVRARADRHVGLPVSTMVESLNAAVATGILLYHLRK